jgi:hypothetical protein
MNIDLLDWNNIPFSHKWVAEDENGQCFSFIKKPTLYSKWWGNINMEDNPIRLKSIEDGNQYTENWLDSLIERPSSVKVLEGETTTTKLWDGIDSKYKYIAKDMDGIVYVYTNEPILTTANWRSYFNNDGHYYAVVICDLLADVDWKHSLRVRPEPNIENKTYTSEQLTAFFVYFNDDIKLEHLDSFLINDYKKEENQAVKLLIGLGYTVTK